MKQNEEGFEREIKKLGRYAAREGIMLGWALNTTD
jgi:hypothetical protein